MKKFSLIIAVAMVLAMILSVGSSAYVNGVRDQYEWSVPKINPENPAIVFDGNVDLEGEWKGALCVSMDASSDSNTYEEITLWTPDVWGGEWSVSTFDELPAEWMITINTYYLWDDNGLYIASKCDDLGVFNGLLTKEQYIKYYEGAVGIADAYDYTGMSGDAFEPMIVPSDREDAVVGNHGGKWPTFWIGTVEGGEAWADFDVTSAFNYETTAYTAENGNPDKDNAIAKQIHSVSTFSATPDADGFYHFGLEIFLPWDYINAESNTSDDHDIIPVGKAGSSFRAGLIYAIRNAADTNSGIRIRYANCMGWNYYDLYTLNANPAEKSDKAAEVVAEEPVVEEPAEEVVEEVAEEPAEEQVDVVSTPTPAPATADVSVLFYALAAVSAIGGISVFKRK